MDKITLKWVGMALLFTWVVTFLYASFGKEIPYFLFGAFLMWIPGVFAIIYAKKNGLKLFTKPNKLYLIGGLLPLVIGGMTFVISLLFGEHQVTGNASLPHPFLFIFVALAAGFTINMGVALGEELMWRGLLVEKLKSQTLLKASLVIGVLWGIWHVPLVLLVGHNYSIHRGIGLFLMLGVTVSMTPLMVILRLKGRSVLVPAVFHGTINALGPYLILLFKEPSPLLVGIQGISGIVTFSLLNSYLFLRYRSVTLEEIDLQKKRRGGEPRQGIEERCEF